MKNFNDCLNKLEKEVFESKLLLSCVEEDLCYIEKDLLEYDNRTINKLCDKLDDYYQSISIAL